MRTTLGRFRNPWIAALVALSALPVIIGLSFAQKRHEVSVEIYISGIYDTARTNDLLAEISQEVFFLLEQQRWTDAREATKRFVSMPDDMMRFHLLFKFENDAVEVDEIKPEIDKLLMRLSDESLQRASEHLQDLDRLSETELGGLNVIVNNAESYLSFSNARADLEKRLFGAKPDFKFLTDVKRVAYSSILSTSILLWLLVIFAVGGVALFVKSLGFGKR